MARSAAQLIAALNRGLAAVAALGDAAIAEMAPSELSAFLASLDPVPHVERSRFPVAPAGDVSTEGPKVFRNRTYRRPALERPPTVHFVGTGFRAAKLVAYTPEGKRVFVQAHGASRSLALARLDVKLGRWNAEAAPSAALR